MMKNFKIESAEDNNAKIVDYFYNEEDILESDTDANSINLTVDDDGKVVVIKYDKQCQSNNDLNAYAANVLRKAKKEFEDVHRVKDKQSLSKHVLTDLRVIFSKSRHRGVKKVDEFEKGADNPDTSNNNRERPNTEKQKSISIYNRCKNWANKLARKASSYYYVLVNNLREEETERKDQKKSKRPIKSNDGNDDDNNVRSKKKKDSKDVEEKKRIEYVNAALRIADF